MTTSFRHYPARAACLVAVAILATACGGTSSTAGGPATPTPAAATCDPIYGSLGLKPSEIAARQQAGACVPQALKVSGEVTSQVQVALLERSNPCTQPERGSALGTSLQFTEGSNLYTLTITPFAAYDRRALDLPLTPGSASTQVTLARQNSDPGALSWRDHSGTLHVDASGTSGTLNVHLDRNATGASGVDISGTWRCAAATATASPSAAPLPGPCGALYSLAALSPGEVQRLTAEPACFPQVLTFTGDPAGAVKEGVHDRASAESLGFAAAEVQCGQVSAPDILTRKSTNTSNLVVLIGDEVFNLHIRLYPYAPGSFGPTFTDIAGQPQPTVTLELIDPRGLLNPGPLTSWTSTAGSVTVSPGDVSGSIDMDLQRRDLGSDDRTHVSGSWRCANQ